MQRTIIAAAQHACTQHVDEQVEPNAGGFCVAAATLVESTDAALHITCGRNNNQEDDVDHEDYHQEDEKSRHADPPSGEEGVLVLFCHPHTRDFH